MSDARPPERVRLWIGLDDTDSLEGGCTTWSMRRMLASLGDTGDFQVIESRLVRLWPFAPHRTRGNAALAAIVEAGPDWVAAIGRIEAAFHSEVISPLAELVTDASPVCVVAPEEPDPGFHIRAVRGEVGLAEAHSALTSASGVSFHDSRMGDRGLIGAVAAIAWPAERWTWELTAWRSEERAATPRTVPEIAVEAMMREFPSTFLNRDPRAGRSIIAPRTPCPVLYGIRSTERDCALDAHAMLQSMAGVEQSVDHAVHRTNQATDDHLPTILRGTVVGASDAIRGGHSTREVWDGERSMRLVAFRPGGEVNATLRRTAVGDVIEWCGMPAPDGAFHLERLRIADPIPRPTSRPRCRCGAVAKSLGATKGLRCTACGSIQPRRWLTSPGPDSDWTQPPPSSRRHLARPLEMAAEYLPSQD